MIVVLRWEKRLWNTQKLWSIHDALKRIVDSEIFIQYIIMTISYILNKRMYIQYFTERDNLEITFLTWYSFLNNNNKAKKNNIIVHLMIILVMVGKERKTRWDFDQFKAHRNGSSILKFHYNIQWIYSIFDALWRTSNILLKKILEITF